MTFFKKHKSTLLMLMQLTAISFAGAHLIVIVTGGREIKDSSMEYKAKLAEAGYVEMSPDNLSASKGDLEGKYWVTATYVAHETKSLAVMLIDSLKNNTGEKYGTELLLRDFKPTQEVLKPEVVTQACPHDMQMHAQNGEVFFRASDIHYPDFIKNSDENEQYFTQEKTSLVIERFGADRIKECLNRAIEHKNGIDHFLEYESLRSIIR